MGSGAWRSAAAAGVVLACGVGARASDDDFYRLIDTLSAGKVDAPFTVLSFPDPAPEPGAQLVASLPGVFRTRGADPELEFRAAPVKIEGLEGAVYFEVARQDSPWSPFRQGVIYSFRRKTDSVVRVFDLVGPSGLREALSGLWAAPDVMPALSLSNLTPNVDLVAVKAGGDLSASTAHPFPTMRSGAIEMTSSLGLAGQGQQVVCADRGFDADGKQVWGPAPKADTRLTRIATSDPAPKVEHLDGGLVTIDVVAGDGPALQTGGSVAIHYTFWLTDGTLVDTSRKPGREPLRTPVPGTQMKGLDSGLIGITKGCRRRLVIPSDLAFGKSGARSIVPPDATLIFDVECLWLENPATPPPAAAPTDPSGPGTPPAASPPK